jgi:hypothetical protein
MSHAVRCMSHNMQRTACNAQHDNAQHATHSMQHTACNAQRATCKCSAGRLGCAADDFAAGTVATVVTHRWKCTVSRHGFSACAGWSRSYRTPAPHRKAHSCESTAADDPQPTEAKSAKLARRGKRLPSSPQSECQRAPCAANEWPQDSAADSGRTAPTARSCAVTTYA